MYKTIVVKYSPKAKEMAEKIEDAANQMEQDLNWFLVLLHLLPRGFWFLDRPVLRNQTKLLRKAEFAFLKEKTVNQCFRKCKVFFENMS